MNKKIISKRNIKPKEGSAPLEYQWQQTMRAMGIKGGFEAQMEGLRFQIRRNLVQELNNFSSHDWIGWVPFDGCCRLSVKCLDKYFEADLEGKRKIQNDSNAELPSGETAIKVSCEPRGRVSLPVGLALAAGIKPNSMVFVRARRWFLEVWVPDEYRRYCQQLSQGARPGLSPTSQPDPS